MVRARGGSVAIASVLTIALAAGTTFAAASPSGAKDSRKQRVEKQLSGAREDLDESSGALKKATGALRDAERALAKARSHQARVAGQTAAARAKDLAMVKELTKATKDVGRAKVDLSSAQERVRLQRHRIGEFASATYRGSGMSDVLVVLSSGDPSDLVDRLQQVRSIGASQRGALDELKGARMQVARRKAILEVVEKLALDRRREAAANLTRMRLLEGEARAVSAKVSRLVTSRAKVRQAARREMSADLARYRQLLAERARIRRLLAEIARRESRGHGSNSGWSGGVGALSRPVYAGITSPFGMRFHPVLHRWKLHDGTDFGASCGTPVKAAAAGRVVARYYNGGYGNRVIISHGGSLATAYNHLSGYAVHSGERVSRGEVVGYVGTTGYSTGCHLHFMVYRNGVAVNPMRYL